MKRIVAIVLFLITPVSVSAVGHSTRVAGAGIRVSGLQDDDTLRDRTREQLGKLLEKAGPTIDVAFSQSEKQPYNYIGTLNTGLVYAESFEIVISVTPKKTIGFRVYPRYKKGYINIDKTKDRAALMRLLLRLSDRAFLFWGADDAGDIFTGYTFTLESGFPEEAISVVLRSIVNSDQFVGEMRPILDAPIVRKVPPAKAPTKKAKTPQRGRRGK